MRNFLGVFLGTGALAWILFVRRPSAHKTLSASRWMLLAWGGLGLVHWLSPIEYLAYRLSTGTVLYCLLWIGFFVLGDRLGFKLRLKRRCIPMLRPTTTTRRRRRFTCVLTMVAVAGMIYLGSMAWRTVISGGVSWFAGIRQAQLEAVGAGLVKTVAIILACGGLVAFAVDLSSSILSNRKVRWLSGLGLLAYLSVYLTTGGRLGLILGGVSLLAVMMASLQFLRTRYQWLKPMLFLIALGILLGGIYSASVAIGRTLGWSGTIDNKIAFLNLTYQSRLDEEFRESLRPFGVAGDLTIELFYYLSPQLYGLEHGLTYYRGNLGWGAVQFPYITRRIEQVFNVNLLQRIVDEDRIAFIQRGLAPNFFRTAVQTTSLDFGPVLALPFVGLCGFLAGRSHTRGMRTRSPYALALQGLVCAGATFTIIYSPFVEPGWAFPVLWLLVLRVLPKRSAPASQPLTEDSPSAQCIVANH